MLSLFITLFILDVCVECKAQKRALISLPMVRACVRERSCEYRYDVMNRLIQYHDICTAVSDFLPLYTPDINTNTSPCKRSVLTNRIYGFQIAVCVTRVIYAFVFTLRCGHFVSMEIL